MGDMSKTVVPKSDQMNAEDLLTGPRTFTITEVRVTDGEQPVSVYFAEFPKGRPFKPSKTVRRLMIRGWGDDSPAYAGHRMTLYTDPDVQFGGQAVGGIRVSHMSGIDRPMRIALAATKGRRTSWVIEPLPAAPPPSAASALAAALAAAGHRTPAEMLAYCRAVVPRPINGASDLTPAEIEQVHEALVAAQSTAVPPAAEPDHVFPTGGVEPSEAELAEAYERERGGDRG